MIDNRKTVDIHLPQFLLKILKKHILKAWFTWMVYIYLYFLPYLIFTEISSTYNSPRFNLSVIIFLIPLIPSSSIKIPFSNTLLAPETTFHFIAKISIALCWSISRDTKSLFNSLTSGVKPCRLFSRNSFPAATRVWSKIYCSDESVSSQTFNYFLCMFSGRSFFLVNYLKILTVTDMTEIFKISVSKRLGHGTHSQNRNAPNARKNTFSHIKCVKVWLQNSNSDIQLPNFSWFASTSLTGLHQPLRQKATQFLP